MIKLVDKGIGLCARSMRTRTVVGLGLAHVPSNAILTLLCRYFLPSLRGSVALCRGNPNASTMKECENIIHRSRSYKNLKEKNLYDIFYEEENSKDRLDCRGKALRCLAMTVENIYTTTSGPHYWVRELLHSN